MQRSSSNDASSSSNSSSDQDSSDWGWDVHSPSWYSQPRRVAVLVLILVSVGLVLAGLVCQVVFKDTDDFTRDYQEVVPWLYFLAAWAPLALALRWLCWKLYAVSRGAARWIKGWRPCSRRHCESVPATKQCATSTTVGLHQGLEGVCHAYMC